MDKSSSSFGKNGILVLIFKEGRYANTADFGN